MTEKMKLREVWAQQCADQPDQEFLIFEDPDTGCVLTYTYAQFDVMTSRLSHALTKSGVNFADRVVVLLGNSVEFVAMHIALSKIGAVLVPMNETSSVEELAHCVTLTQPKLFVTSADYYKELRILSEDFPQLREALSQTFIVSRTALEKSAPEQPGLPEVPELPVLPYVPAHEELAEIMMTSGTTSEPKGVMLTQHNFVFSGHYVNWELAMTCRDRYVTAMAVSHVNFQLSALLPVITAGCTLILLKRYSASTFWNSVRTHRATLVQSMAMMVRTMLRQPLNKDESMHSVREIHYFLPLQDSEKTAFEQRFGVRLLNNYGSTESLIGVITDYPQGERKWPSIGKPGPGYRVEIRNDAGEPVRDGECGTLWIHGEPGKTLMAGYWNDPQATAAVLADGWYNSGDMARIDSAGWYYYLGRRSELIKRAGENISALEVERVLAQCPGVTDVCVVGIPDPIRDEAVKAVVVKAPNAQLTSQDIIEYAKTRLSYFKVPTVVTFVAELPRGQYGKVQRKLLK
ncbi:crotonobetaine/carnitine-CoA ligase [Arcanobacterium pluranimalium]|uniref:AMP-binding protein n=1 Tax=Arcanobacterium pluranimalium TaxID=108028 RepID=UPI001EF896E6|nr:AMP-binding protein [Arcanobacterium pluranimalium]MBM7824786.1 crotonobetaine/carnitine-CoA ligase [Arcanobacterium pluranimalium]